MSTKTPKEIFFTHVFALFKELAELDGEVFEANFGDEFRREWKYGQVEVGYSSETREYTIRRNGWLTKRVKNKALVGLFLTHEFELLYGGEVMDGKKDGQLPEYYTEEYTTRLVRHIAGR